MKSQVDNTHYQFGKYCDIARWGSYHYQLSEIFKCNPKTVLEVGGGDGVVGAYLKKQGIQYTSVDVASDLNPDVVASVVSLPFEDNAYDVVVAFEVLEHLPFEEFSSAVAELVRVSKKHILISLPHYGPSLELWLKVPFLKRIKLALKIPHAPKHHFDGEHYWEIGKAGYPLTRILNGLSAHATVVREYVPFENQYHHFFILNKHE